MTEAPLSENEPVKEPSSQTLGETASSSSTDHRATIQARGWLHGCVLPSTLNDAVILNFGASPRTAADRYVVVSQSCDVVCRDFKGEPTVEVICTRPALVDDEERLHMRNPRVFQFDVPTTGGAVRMEAWARDRGHISRTTRAAVEPETSMPLAVGTSDELAIWLSRRYDRTALPDEFNQRLKDRRKALRKLQRQAGDGLIGIWVRVEPMRELPPGEDYQLILRVVMAKAGLLSESSRQQFKIETYDPLVNSLRSLEGINLINHKWELDDQFTFGDSREMDFLDFDFDLSFGG